MLRHAREDVGVMVLHESGRGLARSGIPGREIVRMPVTGEAFRLHVVEPLAIAENLLERHKCFRRVQVTDMLAEENVVAGCESNGIFQVCPHCHDRTCWSLQTYRQRRIATCPSQHHALAQEQAHDGVVNVPYNRAVMDE
jgi:hypothetical protein